MPSVRYSLISTRFLHANQHWLYSSHSKSYKQQIILTIIMFKLVFSFSNLLSFPRASSNSLEIGKQISVNNSPFCFFIAQSHCIFLSSFSTFIKSINTKFDNFCCYEMRENREIECFYRPRCYWRM